MQHLSWWQRVNAWDWIYPSDERRRWWATVAAWLIAAALGAVLVLLPFIDEWLFPPFGRYWLVMGGRPLHTGEKLAGGVFLLLFVLIGIWVANPNRRRPD